ncbi:phytanoyl-CoA dioxygenase [Planctomycetaceae bacterium SCGC AG-212-F19]|nr:phytanoyl-CoA dioxygenase [Planctomycetaceae bacterium SCGC AG-212-F19]
MTLSPEEQRQLDDAGYVVLENFMDAGLLDNLRGRIDELFREEGERAGGEFKQEPGSRRLANLVDKGAIFGAVVALPRLQPYIAHVLGPEYKLSSVNVRSVNPFADDAQPLHADMGAIADARGYWVCNSVWMIDDFTADNGPIRMVPGSHRWGKLPQEVLSDPKALHPDEVLLTGKAGTVVVMNAHMWHGGTGNRTGNARTAMHVFFARRDKPQQQYQKKLLRAEVQADLTPSLRWLLALDDPLNDAISAAPAVRSGFLK